MSRIIYSNSNGGVSIIAPTSSKANLDRLAAKIVPDGAEYQVVSRAFAFPVDSLFRDAWSWNGQGHPVVEDLEKSRALALEAVKQTTVETAREIAEAALKAELFGDPVGRTQEEVKTACADCVNAINATETVYELKLLMCAYCGLPEPELPRDEQLRIKAEEAKAKLKERLIAIAEAVKLWYEEQVPTVETMPAPEVESVS